MNLEGSVQAEGVAEAEAEDEKNYCHTYNILCIQINIIYLIKEVVLFFVCVCLKFNNLSYIDVFFNVTDSDNILVNSSNQHCLINHSKLSTFFNYDIIYYFRSDHLDTMYLTTHSLFNYIFDAVLPFIKVESSFNVIFCTFKF